MTDDEFQIEEFQNSISRFGWRDLREDLRDLGMIEDVLNVMVSPDAAEQIIHLIDSVNHGFVSPDSTRSVKSVISMQLGGIVHFVQSGAGPCGLPQNKTIYDQSDMIPSPSKYGSLMIVLGHPIPYGAFSKISSAIRKPTGWAEAGWHVRPHPSAVVEESETTIDYNRWIRADKDDPAFTPTPDSVAIQAVMFSIIPVEHEKDLYHTMVSNPRMAVYLESRDLPSVGTLDSFPGITCPPENRSVVVTCDRSQLHHLLASSRVPHITKFYSVFANVIRFTAKAVCSYADRRDFGWAVREWTIVSSGVVGVLPYQIAVASYLLGACYTIRANAPGQVAKRLTACRASMGDEAVTEKAVADFMTESGFIQGLPNSTAAEIMGVAVAIISEKKYDANALRKDLMSVPDIITTYNFDRFTAALYTQLRLVAESLQSSTIRFALAGLVPFSYVKQYAPDVLVAESKDIAELKPQLENRPYTGCADPIPAVFTIANNPHMAYYGVKAFELSLTAEQKEKFKEYNTTGIIEKLSNKSKSAIDSLLVQTPREDDVISSEYLQKLPLELAENHYRSLPPEKRKQVETLLLQSSVECPLKIYLTEQRNFANLEKVNQLLLDKITFHEASTMGLLGAQIEDTFDKETKDKLREKRAAYRSKYAALKVRCKQPEESWAMKISPDALAMHQDHYDKIGKALERVEKGESTDEDSD